MMDASFVPLSLRDHLAHILDNSERATLYVGLFDLLPSRYRLDGREADYPFYARASLYVPEGIVRVAGAVFNKHAIEFVPIACNRVRHLAGFGLYLSSYDRCPVIWSQWSSPLRTNADGGYLRLAIRPGGLILAREVIKEST